MCLEIIHIKIFQLPVPVVSKPLVSAIGIEVEPELLISVVGETLPESIPRGVPVPDDPPDFPPIPFSVISTSSMGVGPCSASYS